MFLLETFRDMPGYSFSTGLTVTGWSELDVKMSLVNLFSVSVPLKLKFNFYFSFIFLKFEFEHSINQPKFLDATKNVQQQHLYLYLWC